ncbi:hypothetical protein Sme01_65090 [Sphaerisporangium melleum]|uniref:Uncharacterized protein n=1 Tax=Sphaerisporangium melleum TaxID=321316 RepID=A0A917RDV8_9ACTN|nr:hypothetical protein [Sphaerisporangium melleum]GGL03665.1 hypothetical protein GCM10007964_52210 [Sphaerisporangium melleum]GII74033.1 hypothetical protein Sme01_65090 [Sphaerisporangium melleum]
MPKPRVTLGRGRHRIGAPFRPVPSHRWDLAKKAAAAQLDQLEPAWLVYYGPGTRRFVAIAVWPAPRPLQVDAFTVEELRALMREAEVEAAIAA